MKARESEKITERYLCQQVEKKLNGTAYKFVSPQRRFVPDRLCVLPHGMHFFVEVKSEGDPPNKGQLREIKRLQNMEHPVWVAWTKRDVDLIITAVLKQVADLKGSFETHLEGSNE